MTVTLTGTPAFSGGFAVAVTGGLLRCDGVTYAGAATGIRSNSDANSTIIPALTAFPGNSGGAVPIGGPGLQMVASGPFSAVGAVDVLLSAAYDEYEIHFNGTTFSNTGRSFCARTSTNGGSSYDSAASSYQSVIQWAGGGAPYASFYSGGTTQIEFGFVDNAANDINHFVIRVRRHADAKRCLISSVGASFQTTNTYNLIAAGARLAIADVDAVRFFPDVGTMSGTYKVYGIR
jgi:hypothetical protein